MRDIHDQSVDIPAGPTGRLVRRMLRQADHDRRHGRFAVAEELEAEARALAAATTQHQRALMAVTNEVSRLIAAIRELSAHAEHAALDDRPTDPCLLTTLHDDLRRAQARMILLEVAQP